MISLIYTACNQGDWVRKTLPLAVESLGDMPHEIIVVDDQSIDGCCHQLGKDCLIVRTEHRVGVSAARRIGAKKARGGVFIFSDPHCEYPDQALQRLARLAEINRAIVQPPTKNRPESSRVAYGGRLEDSERGILVRTSRDRAQPWPALMNTIYALRRDVYDTMGGWPELPGCWGYSEQAMTLLAWLCDVPVVVADTAICVHRNYQINRRLPYYTSRYERAVNAHHVHGAFFPAAYKDRWRAVLDQFFGYADQCAATLREPSFKNLQRQLDQHAVLRNERQLLDHVDGLAALAPIGQRDEKLIDQQRPRTFEIGHAKDRARLRRSFHWFVQQLPGCIRGKSVLDVGTQDGLGCEYLQRMGARYVEGVELVPEMAAEAKRRGRPVREGDMRQLGDLSNHWDLVTCIHALEHVPDPERALSEMVRVLRPGGWLLIVVPRENEPRRLWAHNYAFPDSHTLKRLVRRQKKLDHAMSVKIVKYTDQHFEIRLAAQKKR